MVLIGEGLDNNPPLKHAALAFEIQANVGRARELYDKRDLKNLVELLNHVSPQTAVLLNLQIAVVSPQLTESSGTLSQTLLPYLNMISAFDFIKTEDHFIMGRFLNALVVHHKDVEEPLGKGLILLALQLNPMILQGLSIKGLRNLNPALETLGVPSNMRHVILNAAEKFLFADLIRTLIGKSEETGYMLAQIIAKSDVLTSPVTSLPDLEEVINQRVLLGKCLTTVERIKMSIPRLVSLLHKLVPLDSSSIHTCLEQDSSQWEKFATQANNFEELKEHSLSSERVIEYYSEHTRDTLNLIPLDDMLALSRTLSDLVPEYRHNEY